MVSGTVVADRWRVIIAPRAEVGWIGGAGPGDVEVVYRCRFIGDDPRLPAGGPEVSSWGLTAGGWTLQREHGNAKA